MEMIIDTKLKWEPTPRYYAEILSLKEEVEAKHPEIAMAGLVLHFNEQYEQQRQG